MRAFLARLLLFTAAALAAAGYHALAAAAQPTEDQLRLIERLTPEQRAAALKALQKEGQVRVEERRPQEAPAAQPRPLPPARGGKPSPIEAAMARAAAATGGRIGALRQYGYDLFAGVPSTFAPATDIPVPPDYVIGPGDTVQVQLFGKVNAEYSLVVTREGILNFPEIGPIPVAGLSFREMRALLERRIAEQMIGVRSAITMGPLRSIRVFVLGEARRPGSYTVSALATMTNALFAGGGVRPIGSLRRIQLKRQGRAVTTLDLYDLLLRGDTRADARLQPGDVIFVPPIGPTVGVAGEVRRPGIYELAGERTVGEVLALAGGLLPTAYPPATQLVRVDEKGERRLIDVDLGAKAAWRTPVRDGDLIRVYSILEKTENAVLLAGHVQRPGPRQWRPGMRLSDLIPSIADDLLPEPDLDYALVRREEGPTRSVRVFSVRLGEALRSPGSAADVALRPRDRVYVFPAYHARRPDTGATPSGRTHAPQTGREELSVDRRFELRAEPGNGSRSLSRRGRRGAEKGRTEDVRLYARNASQGGKAERARAEIIAALVEELRAHAKHGEPARVVRINGLVRFPGEYPLERGMRVSDLVRAGGGLSEAAYTLGAELTRYEVVDGKHREIDHVPIDLASALAGKAEADLLLRPHDVLHVKRMPQWAEGATVEIRGEVRFPGVYPIARGEQLSSVIRRAGGLTDMAFPEGAVFMRRSLQEKEAEQLRKLADRLETELAAAELAKEAGDKEAQAALAVGRQLIAQLRATRPVGRLVIDLPRLLRESAGGRRSDIDVTLRDGDVIVIPPVTQEVTVIGEVFHPTSHLWRRGLTRDDYIRMSGGTTRKADRRNIYVVRASGAVIAGRGGLLTDLGTPWFEEVDPREIRPGDTIVVPLDINRIRPLTFWTNVSQIIYQIGVAAAAWKTVGVF